MTTISAQEKAERFRKLHYSGEMLVLPNIWDTLGALLLEDLEYPAIATASASIAYANGYNDGEKIPYKDLLLILKRIADSVNIPVTADFESGYADNNFQLQENIKLLIGTGIAGINIEDTDNNTNKLCTIKSQCNKIRLLRKVSDEAGIPLFINARTDVYLQGKEFATPEEKLGEIIRRGIAFKEAGADGFYPILLSQAEDIKQVIIQVKLPLNILTIPGIPDLRTLAKLGVARVSLGPSFLKMAIKAMRSLAIQLKDHDGLSLIAENEISTDYLKALVKKNIA